ncbi:hypothetical protein AB0C40_08225 [Streptomyces brevispora]|uniref:hypothetical protein n=1 Tax=Streptomyces brevispora TaxID=887462 RepID=UPI0033E8F38D
MTPRRKQWARLCRQLCQHPRPYGEPSAAETRGRASWSFSAARVAHHLAEHPTRHDLGEFATVFALMWIAWLNDSIRVVNRM